MTLLISADRPSPKVAAEVSWLEALFNRATNSVQCFVLPAPMPVVSGGGCKWMQALNLQYEQLLELDPGIEAGMLWDDDALFSGGALTELVGHLLCFEFDRLEVLSTFLWNHPDKYNAAFPAHWSACLFRVYPGDRWPTNFEVNCPRHVARSDRAHRLRHPWLNYGYMDPDGRRETFEAQKRAGKVDAHTLCLINKPDLKDLPDTWR